MMAHSFPEIATAIKTLAEVDTDGSVTPSGLAEILRRLLNAVETISAAENIDDLAGLVENAVSDASDAKALAVSAKNKADDALSIGSMPVRLFSRFVESVDNSDILATAAPEGYLVAWAAIPGRFLAYLPANPGKFYSNWKSRDTYLDSDGIIHPRALFALTGSIEEQNVVSLFVAFGNTLVKALPGDVDLDSLMITINGKFTEINNKFNPIDLKISNLETAITNNKSELEQRFSSFAPLAFSGCVDVQMPAGTITPARKYGVPSIGFVETEGHSTMPVAEVWYSFGHNAFIGARGSGVNKRWFSSWMGSDSFNYSSDGVVAAKTGLKCVCDGAEWIVDRAGFRPALTAIIDYHNFGDLTFDEPGVPPFADGYYIPDALVDALMTARVVRFVAANGVVDVAVSSAVSDDDGNRIINFSPIRNSSGQLIAGVISISADGECCVDFSQNAFFSLISE